MSVFEVLMQVKAEKGAGYFVLLDPDRSDDEAVVEIATECRDAGVDAILVGSSMLLSVRFEHIIALIKRTVDLPLIISPGGVGQISRHADALFFYSLISGRNPELLIGQQVKAAPVLKAYNLEAIPTGYMLIESGNFTSAEYISDTRPIPRNKSDIAKAHALTAEYLGMKMVYLEAGSGARLSVPEEMIRGVAEYISLPIIVGGGIRDPEEARKKVQAGASFVVTGNVMEKSKTPGLIRRFAEAVHG
ncbi:MAG: geranylgeranylglyceryl/heptaprenylglyceryl phosphate synthase [Candidatus Latescibacteria bacterium 4484_107]|nr:MAG: geranylgeranylglyceryl/heptaprenylglyceryl phosphate synthase [Candidatus Latescibacteria bacterium 4484_107]